MLVFYNFLIVENYLNKLNKKIKFLIIKIQKKKIKISLICVIVKNIKLSKIFFF